MGLDEELFDYSDVGDGQFILKNDEENKQLQEENKQLQSDLLLVVDRIEGSIAVCENRATREISEIELSKLPSGTKEGNIVRYINGVYVLDAEEQESIEQRIAKKMDDLWN